MEIPEIIFDMFPHNHSTRLHKGKSRSYEFRSGKKLKSFSNYPMISLSCFFERMKMRVERFFIFKCVTVDTSKLFIFCISKPVRTCKASNLEATGVEFTSICNMRTSTHIDKLKIFYLISIHLTKTMKSFFDKKVLKSFVSLRIFSF